MNNAYVEQKAGDLVFFTIDGILTCTKFETFAKGEVENENSKVEAAVIGASHYIIVDVWGKKITEILACVDLDPNEKIIAQVNLGLVPAGNINFDFGNLPYHFQWKIYSWEEGEYQLSYVKNLAEKKQGEEGYIVLNPKFPMGKNLQTIPETLVVVGMGRDEIVCNTIHTYPDQTYPDQTYPDQRKGKIVHTMSRLHFKHA